VLPSVIEAIHDAQCAEHGAPRGYEASALARPNNLPFWRPTFFLGLNGLDLSAGEVEAVSTMLSLAAGDIGEHTFADWFRKHARALLRRS
jgi:hypothetical protein